MCVYLTHTRQYIRPQRQHSGLALAELKKYKATPGAVFGELLYNGDCIAIVQYETGETIMTKQYQQAATHEIKTPYVRAELKRKIVDEVIPFDILSITGPDINTIKKENAPDVQVKQYTLRIAFDEQYTSQFGLSKEMLLYIEWDKYPTSGRNKFIEQVKQDIAENGSPAFSVIMEKKITNSGRPFYTLRFQA